MLALFLIVLVPGAFCDFPVVTNVQLSLIGQMRHVTVRYTADTKPVVLWKALSYMAYLNNCSNTFSDNQGEASVWINTVEFAQNINFTLAAEIYSDSYHMSYRIAKGNVRLNPITSPVTPVGLITSPEGTISFTDDEVVQINVKVEADDLSQFTIDSDWGHLSSFEYISYPPVPVYRRRVWNRQNRHFENANAFIWPQLNITSGSDTVANSIALIDTSYPYVTGEYQFGVKLLLPDTHIISDIVFRRYVYLKKESDESPFRTSANFVYDNLNRKRVDILIKDHGYTQIDAMGYPKPALKLFRECTEVAEPEVRVFDIGTPYRTRNIFQFRPTNSSLTGAYYFTAVSGDTTLTEMKFITQLS